MIEDIKLKQGWSKKLDIQNNMVHIFPTEGRAHNYDKCWCFPFLNKDTMITHHHYSKENKLAECEK